MTTSTSAIRRALIACAVAAVALLPGALAQQPPAPASQLPPPPAAPSTITMAPGELHTVEVDEIKRVAVGDPNVVDVSVVSPKEILLQAKGPGATNVIIWDRAGQRTINVKIAESVEDTGPGLEQQLQRMVQELKLKDVHIRREHDKIFLVGEVPTKDDLDRVGQLAGTYGAKVTNLVGLATSVAEPRLVRLNVQVVEISRLDLERLGVKWFENMRFVEQGRSVGPGPLIEKDQVLISTNDSLASRVGAAFRIGRIAQSPTTEFTINALVRKNRARILSEPKLVTASGKKAESTIGFQVPILKATTTVFGNDIIFRDTGVVLRMTPTIHDDPVSGVPKITTVIEAELSEPDSQFQLDLGTTKIPSFKTKKVNTEITTESGETVLIAGLLLASQSKNIDQIPALGSIPFLGRLFRIPENNLEEREIAIIVTPELLDNGTSDMTAERSAAVDQALATGEPPPATDEAAREFAGAVQAHLAKGIGYPDSEQVRGTTGQVKLRLHIARNGDLIKADILEGSGVPVLDQEALKGAIRQAPYPAFSKPLEKQADIWVDVPVLFTPQALESGASDAELTREPAFETPTRRYATMVQERLAKGIRYPDRERQGAGEGKVTVRLHLYHNGRLGQALVAASSGSNAFDLEAVQAAERQAPYPPFPDDLRDSPDLWLDLPVVFKP